MPEWYAQLRNPILLLQSVLGVFVFAYSLNRRRPFVLRVILSTALGCVILIFVRAVFFPEMGTRVNSLGRVVMSALVFFLLALVCWSIYDESFWTALFVTSSGFAAQDMGGTFKTLLKLFPGMNALAQDKFGIILMDCIAYLGVYAVLYIAFRPFTRNREENFGNRGKAIFPAFVLLFGLGMARITQGNAERNQISVFAESVYQILCGIFILLIQFGVMERDRLSRSVDAMRELVHQQHEQFRQSQESIALVNEKYHDLKGLLESFQGRISQEQIVQLKSKIGEYDTFVDTGNHVLNVVLAEKRAVCDRRNIELTAYVDGRELSFLEELDLYALIGNALNNAIDAAAQVRAEDRFITLTVSAYDGMVTIHVENPYSGDLVMDHNLPRSQRDARYHGFGMKSMERIAEKYGGALTVQPKDGVFRLDIILFQP